MGVIQFLFNEIDKIVVMKRDSYLKFFLPKVVYSYCTGWTRTNKSNNIIDRSDSGRPKIESNKHNKYAIKEQLQTTLNESNTRSEICEKYLNAMIDRNWSNWKINLHNIREPLYMFLLTDYPVHQCPWVNTINRTLVERIRYVFSISHQDSPKP